MRTKLVCTIGPASAERVTELAAAGMDVARINFSHGTPAEHAAAAAAAREAAVSVGRPIAVLADLAGPKIRLADLEGGSVELEAGRTFELRPDGGRGRGTSEGASVTYEGLGRDLRPGDRILLADGAAELRVTQTGESVIAEIVRGGTVRSRAGVSVPAERLSTPILTERDLDDLPRLDEIGATYVAQSFVRSGEDVRQLRDRLGPAGLPIVAKIETRPAIDDFDAILDQVDAVMIARGDLGVELPYEQVPIIQKQLVRRSLDRGVPTIVATQMLESMTSAPRPTRAEASDVANAVFDGADAIMLSGETAIGAYPVLAAEAAVRIARLCEREGVDHLAEGAAAAVQGDAGALAYAAVALAGAEADVAAIACYTQTGRTARLLAALRPRVPIVAFSPDARVVDRLALVHGVTGRTCQPLESTSRLALLASHLRTSALAPDGTAVVLVASTTDRGSGPNSLELLRLPA